MPEAPGWCHASHQAAPSDTSSRMETTGATQHFHIAKIKYQGHGCSIGIVSKKNTMESLGVGMFTALWDQTKTEKACFGSKQKMRHKHVKIDSKILFNTVRSLGFSQSRMLHPLSTSLIRSMKIGGLENCFPRTRHKHEPIRLIFY